jgi:dTDP-3-amino-3,4,6-trideoxy-alpha-D-glucose transaminase
MMNIPFIDLTRAMNPIRAEIERAMSACLDRSSYLRGPETAAFEEEWAAFCGQAAAVCCNSGTDALSLAAMALGIKDAIIPANTLPLTGIGLHRGGAAVQIGEVDENGWIATASDHNVPVLLFGRTPAPSMANAALYDAAHAHGWHPPASAAAAWSFYPTKTLGAIGDAGAITTNDVDLAREMRNLCGRDDQLYDSRQLTSRIDEIQAAVLRVKLRHLPNWLDERKALGDAYRRCLAPLNMCISGPSLEHLFCIRTPNRNALKGFLAAHGVGTKIHWDSALHQLAGPWTAASECPIAENWSKSVLSLPIYPGLTFAEVDRVCELIATFVGQKSDASV